MTIPIERIQRVVPEPPAPPERLPSEAERLLGTMGYINRQPELEADFTPLISDVATFLAQRAAARSDIRLSAQGLADRVASIAATFQATVLAPFERATAALEEAYVRALNQALSLEPDPSGGFVQRQQRHQVTLTDTGLWQWLMSLPVQERQHVYLNAVHTADRPTAESIEAMPAPMRSTFLDEATVRRAREAKFNHWLPPDHRQALEQSRARIAARQVVLDRARRLLKEV